MWPLGVLHQPGSRAPSSAGPGPGGGGPPSRLALAPRCCTIAPGPGAARRRRGPSASSAAGGGGGGSSDGGAAPPCSSARPPRAGEREAGRSGPTDGGGRRSAARSQAGSARPRRLRQVVPRSTPHIVLRGLRNCTPRAPAGSPSSLLLGRGPRAPLSAPPPSSVFLPARPRRRARHPSPSPSAGRCGARGAAPCKHRGARLGCGRATPRARAARHPLLGREPGICISQSLAAEVGRGSCCGAGRSCGWDWGCRMKSVSFLRLGTSGRVGWGTPSVLPFWLQKIGRASCRERVSSPV